jgi:hypothetical protein
MDLENFYVEHLVLVMITTLQWWNTLNHKIPKVRAQRERKGRIGTHFFFNQKDFPPKKNEKN